MILIEAIHYSLGQLKNLLGRLDASEYSRPNALLLDASLGQHTRHIVEMYQCLLDGYENGVLNYDLRKRDLALETDIQVALLAIDNILGNIRLENKTLHMESSLMNKEMMRMETNYERELHYNLEHTIHHMAIIRIGLGAYPHIPCESDFGVAHSTVEYLHRQKK